MYWNYRTISKWLVILVSFQEKLQWAFTKQAHRLRNPLTYWGFGFPTTRQLLYKRTHPPPLKQHSFTANITGLCTHFLFLSGRTFLGPNTNLHMIKQARNTSLHRPVFGGSNWELQLLHKATYYTSMRWLAIFTFKQVTKIKQNKPQRII